MTEATAVPTPEINPEIVVPDTAAELLTPVVHALERYPILPCDAHANGGIQALFRVEVPGWASDLLFCGHCAREHGYRAESARTWMDDESKSTGSAN